VNIRNQNVLEPCGNTREVYSVDGVRVTLDARRGWQCACLVRARGLECTHIERANVFKQMRGVKREDDTVELEFSAAQLQALEHAAVEERTDLCRVEEVVRPNRGLQVSRWAAVVSVLAVSGISSGVTYFATSRTQAAHAIHAIEDRPSVPLPSRVAPYARSPETPFKLANPFDATEVFEFPPTTSESAARQAVADFLMKRARDRLAASADRQSRTDNIVDAGSQCAGQMCSTQLIRTASSLNQTAAPPTAASP
jgi:hypothetical protein